jgi:hypothetical protein
MRKGVKGGAARGIRGGKGRTTRGEKEWQGKGGNRRKDVASEEATGEKGR